jgi:hypothetical protein
MSGRFAESVVEEAALAWLETLGWEIRHGPASPRASPTPSAATRATATSSWKAGCGRHWRG